MKKHFVVFCSPGTFFSEQTEKEIPKWDVEAAKKMAKHIKERYGAAPYGFYFITKERRRDELNSKQTKQSGMYFLGGKIMTLAEVRKEMPNEHILISNMECNHWDKIIINTNSWKVTLPFTEEDRLIKGAPSYGRKV